MQRHTSALPAVPALRPERADDSLPDLPPLDGADNDAPEDAAPLLDDDAVPKDDGGDPFDDATGERDAAPELPGLDEETLSLLDAGEAEALDIGAPDLLGNESDKLTDDGREEAAAHDDYDLGDGLGDSALDGGEEGPSDEDESLTDEGLPSLGGADEDDDAQEDAASFFEGDLSDGPSTGGRREEAVGEAQADAWSSLWERFGSPLSLPPTRALACAPDGVLTAGRELVRVDLEGATERLAARGLRGAEVTRVVLSGRELFATTETGGLFVSRDGGATFAELPAWRELVRPEEAAAGLDVVASADGTLWGRTAQGSLLSSRDRGERWAKVDVDGFVRAVGTDDEGDAVVLVRALGASEVLRSTGSSEGAWSRASLPAELSAEARDGHATVVAYGSSVAIAVGGAGVFRSLDGGVWSRVAGMSLVTAIAMLDTAGTLVVALAPGSVETDGQSAVLHLARVGADGEPKVVAVWEERSEGATREPGEAGDLEGGVTAIAVDQAHEVVWVAGGFGVAAFQPRMRKAV